MTEGQICNGKSEGTQASTCVPFCYEPKPPTGGMMGKLGCFVIGTLVGAGAVALAAVIAEEWPFSASTSELDAEDGPGLTSYTESD